MPSVLTAGRRAVTHRLRTTTAGTCAVFALDNQLAKLRLVRGDIGTDSGAAHAAWDIEASLAYIDRVHGEYLAEAGLAGFGGRVAEVGPGDNCGVALRMLADGAWHVDLVDRFYSARDPEQHAAIYRALIARDPGLRRFAGLSREEDFEGLVRHYGAAASAEQFFVENRGYDFIVSRAVMEHVTDPVISLQRMRAALNPGGLQVHVVDLRDHGMFTEYGFHELKFLEVPGWLYGEMTRATGRPNRVPLSAYRMAAADAEIRVTHLVGPVALDRPMAWADIPAALREAALAQVRRRKPGLQPRFRAERDEDLAVTGFFLLDRA